MRKIAIDVFLSKLSHVLPSMCKIALHVKRKRWICLEETVSSYQSCNRTVRSSRYIVFDRKSIPIVAWITIFDVPSATEIRGKKKWKTRRRIQKITLQLVTCYTWGDSLFCAAYAKSICYIGRKRLESRDWHFTNQLKQFRSN